MREPKRAKLPRNHGRDGEGTLRALAAVRKEKETLAALLSNMSDEVWMTDAEGTSTLANPSAMREFGLQPGEEVPVERLAARLEVLRPDGSPRPLQEAPPLRALAGERVVNQEEIVRTPATGELRYRQVCASPVRDPSGRITGSVAVVRDVTEARRAEQERERLLTVIEASLNEIYLFDPASLKFSFANGRARRNLGYSMAELLEVTPVDLAPAFTEASFRAVIEPLMKGDEGLLTFSTLHRRQDGTHYPVEVHLQFVKAGNQPAFLALVHDITDRLKTEETILIGEGRYRSVVESAKSAIIFMDLDHRILEWNRAAEAVFGYGREEVLGQDYLRAFVPDAQQAALGLEIEKVLAGEPLQDFESAVVRKDGTFRTLLWNATRILGGGGTPEGLFIIGQDITPRRRAEQQLEALNADLERQVLARTAQLEGANRELEAFSYSVSHDLKAPLRAIAGLAEALQEDCSERLDDEGRRLTAAIRSNAKRMSQLIEDLLALSRAGRKELVRSEVDMADLARTVFLEVASPRAREGVRFTVSDLPAAWGDPSLLRQVWENLLANALKFSSGEASPSIEVWGETVDGKSIYRVRDNGAGFDPEFASKLFNAFQRLHGEAEFEGTGIGLAIVRRILHRHGGSAWAEGRPGEGATFSFALPAKDAGRD